MKHVIDMMSGRCRFEDFTLDPTDRQLRRAGELVEINARYLDALLLLIREQGRLVTKERFLNEVWRGVPVTEEALTQCIRTLRRQLGDSVANPRFIETAPKHGYRFVAAVEWLEGAAPAPQTSVADANTSPSYSWRQCLLLGVAGLTGAGVAGVLGGLFYGFFAGASQSLVPDMGAVSMLLVLVCLTAIAALMGGAGVSFGIATAALLPGRWRWSVVGGAAGGLLVGAVAKLLGLDAFNLLFGQSPGDITGAPEGLLLGGAVGFGVWWGSRGAVTPWTRRSIVAAALAGGVVGVVVPLLGGRLMGGSLELLAHSFPHSRLRLDEIGALVGERGFGPISQALTGGLEGALFGACIVGAMVAFSPLLAAQPKASGRRVEDSPRGITGKEQG